MIVTLLLQLFSSILKMVCKILPDWSIPDYIISTYTYGINVAQVANGYFAIEAVFNCLWLFIHVASIIMLIKLVAWLLSLARGGGGAIDI